MSYKHETKTMSERIEINGVWCELDIDQNGLFDVFIADGNPPPFLPEWLVRGAINKETAIHTAEELLTVKALSHTHPAP